MFVHLNTHSVYSSMRGLLSLPDLVDLSHSYGMDTLALTDVNGMWGFIRFVQHFKNAGLSPIAGTNLITEKMKPFFWPRVNTAMKIFVVPCLLSTMIRINL